MKVNGFSALMAATVATWALLLSWQIAFGAEASAPTLRPAELPPPDFRASQYIDSAGCVFLREGSGWTPRRERGGAPICGYPPTLSARHIGPGESTARFPGPAEDDTARIARELTETVMAGLQPGELAGAGDRAEVTSPGLNRPQGDDSASLTRMIAAAPQLRAEMARASAGNHTAQLCSLLGAEPFGAGGPGAQDALGLCGAMMAVDLPQPAISAGATASVTVSSAPAPRPAAVPQVAPRASPKAAPASAANSAPDGTKPTSAPRPTKTKDTTGMIPAGARFIQVGMFRDEASVRRIAARLAALGLPAGRGEATLEGERLMTVLAGPFDTREKLVRALHRLRSNGFPNAYPR